MKYLLTIVCIAAILAQPVSALDYTVPTAPANAEQLMPIRSASFWEDFIYVVKSALRDIEPYYLDALEACIIVFCIVLISTLFSCFPSASQHTVQIITAVLIGVQLLHTTHNMINLARETIHETMQYGKLLLPSMAGLLASQGATASSAALYSGTALFSSLLSSLISKLLVPMVYIFLCLCIGNCALGDDMFTRLRDFVKWLLTWSLKILLYVFLGYMSVTGVISGSVDASAMRATKLTLSGFVPVIGNILSEASETILVSASIMKNTAGVYGLVALSAILVIPFFKIGTQYIFLKVTGAICSVFDAKKSAQLIVDFSSAMGFMLAMTGITSLLLMVSIVCIMKGAA